MKRRIIGILFLSILIASILYLIPDFSFTYKDKIYSFTNFPSVQDKSQQNLEVKIPGLTTTYRYKIESAVKVDGKTNWNYIVSKDQKNLEKRIESFLGNDYEVRLDRVDNKAVFTINTLKSLGSSESILITDNSDFSISVADSTVYSDTSALTKTKLNLNRSDFGPAEINIVSQSQNIQYQVRLPLGLLIPEKINLINSHAFSTLSVTIGGKEYNASFTLNDTGIPTHLTISSAANIDEAAAIRAYLNTEPYGLGYELSSVELSNPKYPLYKLAGLTLVFIVAAIVINKLTINSLNPIKIFMILSFLIIGLGLMKLFAISLNSGIVVLLMLVTTFALFSTKTTYYIGSGAVILLTLLLGLLNYFELSWSGIFIVLVVGFLMWTTGFIRSKREAYNSEVV